MEVILAVFSRIAPTAKIAMITMAITIVQAATKSGASPVSSALKSHNRLFAIYMVLIVLAAVFTYLVWKSGNKVQDAVQADALARIEEAKRGASEADAKAATAGESASKANERANKLENGNLILRGQVATLEASAAQAQKDVASLQKAAAEAKAAQQRVEIDLGKQREKTATAERSLLELQRYVAPRRISSDQKTRLIDILKTGPKGEVGITCVMGDGEGAAFAQQVAEVLIGAGWTVSSGGVSQAAYVGGNPIGFGIIVHSAVTAPPHAAALQRAFFSVGLPLGGAEENKLPQSIVNILVGNKPN